MDKDIEIKGCPFCGAKINHKVKIINFFECPECGAVVSFTGEKKLMPNVYEAFDPIGNWNRRAENA